MHVVVMSRPCLYVFFYAFLSRTRFLCTSSGHLHFDSGLFAIYNYLTWVCLLSLVAPRVAIHLLVLLMRYNSTAQPDSISLSYSFLILSKPAYR